MRTPTALADGSTFHVLLEAVQPWIVLWIAYGAWRACVSDSMTLFFLGAAMAAGFKTLVWSMGHGFNIPDLWLLPLVAVGLYRSLFRGSFDVLLLVAGAKYKALTTTAEMLVYDFSGTIDAISPSTQAIMMILPWTILFLSYVIYRVFIGMLQDWEVSFAQKKLSRFAKGSPRDLLPPKAQETQERVNDIIDAADLHRANFQDLDSGEILKQHHTSQRVKFRRLKKWFKWAKLGMFVTESEHTTSKQKRVGEGTQRALDLDMDYIYISFFRYVWSLLFIGVCGMFLWVKGSIVLRVRAKLYDWGIIKPKPFDPAEVVGRLCLEGSMAIHYHEMKATTLPDGSTQCIAGFYFPNFPIVTRHSTVEIKDIFAVEIDLETRCMTKAKLDDRELAPDEALILCWFNTIAMNHVKMHALANWGVNVDDDQFDKNPFVARNSLVTVMYNYFGYVAFGRFFDTWKKMGIMHQDWDFDALRTCFDLGVKDNIWHHPNISELARYSRFVNFIVRVREIFHKEFNRHRRCFADNVHVEALFVGTVLHSLDHTIMDRNLEDPLWLHTHGDFGMMAELGRIVKVGFVGDVPGIYFHKRFKGAHHPFYDSVYRQAALIDTDFADHMDTCIIK